MAPQPKLGGREGIGGGTVKVALAGEVGAHASHVYHLYLSAKIARSLTHFSIPDLTTYDRWSKYG